MLLTAWVSCGERYTAVTDLTPVARVAFSVAAFAVEHDRMYVILTMIVLGALLCRLLAA